MSPRARALAHLKSLAAAGGVVAACHDSGYGVVDPLPPPACFSNPEPSVTARYVGEAAADGARVVEITIKHQRPDAKVGKVRVSRYDSGTEIPVNDPDIAPDTIRTQFTAPKDLKRATFSVELTCQGGSDFYGYLELEPTSVKLTPQR